MGPSLKTKVLKEGLEIYFSPSIKQNEQYVLRERKSPRRLVHLKKKLVFFTRAHTHTHTHTEAVGIFSSPLVPEILVPV